MVLDVALRRVTRVFDGVPAISQVSLDVSHGERIWLRGSNGSGKSTLLQVVATALSPTLGGGEVLGFDVVRERQEVRARTELLGHQSRLYRELTAVENLEFSCRLYGADASRMRQRLALARCLVRDPQLVLLDEPYAGLDVEARAVVDDLLDRAARHARTVLLASHEEPPAGTVDRVVFMDAGRVAPVAEALR
jgi:heme exporter protein A